jgi:hypothetical protein
MVHLVLMAWVGQKSVHRRQAMQMCILTGYTSSSTIPNTPMEHISMQVPHLQQGGLSICTSTAIVAGAEISTFHSTLRRAPGNLSGSGDVDIKTI